MTEIAICLSVYRRALGTTPEPAPDVGGREFTEILPRTLVTYTTTTRLSALKFGHGSPSIFIDFILYYLLVIVNIFFE